MQNWVRLWQQLQQQRPAGVLALPDHVVPDNEKSSDRASAGQEPPIEDAATAVIEAAGQDIEPVIDAPLLQLVELAGPSKTNVKAQLAASAREVAGTFWLVLFIVVVLFVAGMLAGAAILP
jgi:hypothetical protein